MPVLQNRCLIDTRQGLWGDLLSLGGSFSLPVALTWAWTLLNRDPSTSSRAPQPVPTLPLTNPPGGPTPAPLERRCRLSGVTDPDFFLAGHNKPWRSATNAERIDGQNRLRLVLNFDRQFDRGADLVLGRGKLQAALAADGMTGLTGAISVRVIASTRRVLRVSWLTQ